MALNLGTLKKTDKLPTEDKQIQQESSERSVQAGKNKPKKSIVEYSRNLLHKNTYEPNEIDPVLRDRLNVGKHITVPVFYEEEKLFKDAASASIDEQGRAYSLNDFIRVAVVKAAYEVLGQERADAILKDKYNLTSTTATVQEEREAARKDRQKAKDAAIRSDVNEYPRSPTKTRKRKSPDELASRGRKSNTKPVIG